MGELKKVLAVILCSILIISTLVIPAAANDINVEISGRRTESDVAFSVKLENLSAESAEAVVYLATFEADESFKNLDKYVVTVEANSTVYGVYTADISQGEAQIFVWNSSMQPVLSMSSESCTLVDSLYGEKLDVESSDAWASNVETTSSPAGNAFDGSTSTKWAVTGSDESITAYLGENNILSRVGIAFDGGSSKEYIFSVSVSEDGENFKTLLDSQTSTKTNSLQYFDVATVKARYIRITINGVNSGSITGIKEIEAYGFDDTLGEMLMNNAEADDNWQISAMDEMTTTGSTPTLGSALYAVSSSDGLLLYDNMDRTGDTTGEKLTITSVSASQTPESANKPSNTIDGNTSTIWTASGVTDAAPATLVADLGAKYTVSTIGIGFDLGASRTYNYSVEVSEDGDSYTTVISKRTAQSTNSIQTVSVDNVSARYVRYTIYARTDSSNNGWIRVSEIEIYGGEEGPGGAGGVLAQKTLDLPEGRGDFELSFDLTIPSSISGTSTDATGSGISVTDGIITGGADLNNYAAIQLRFENSGNNVKINQILSNYFNEGDSVSLFENTFKKDETLKFSLLVSPLKRRCYVTVSDSSVTETQLVNFSYCDDELTRNSAWTGLTANTLVFNTGAAEKVQMTVSNINLRQVESESNTLTGDDPVNGIIRLEATRLSTYPTTSGDYYGRYFYHNGGNATLSVAADKNPALTRFVERRGLIGTGVSLESVSMPGYFVVAEMGDAFYLKKLENTGSFYAKATFYKETTDNVGYYTGKTYKYRTYLQAPNSAGSAMEDKYLYDTTSDYITGTVKPSTISAAAQATFYLRSEASAYVCDNFYGNSISSQWWTNYPWKSNNPTNDSYNFSALITKNNVIVENGELLLKATQIASNAWPTDTSGETGKQYNGDFGRTDWVKWKGYVGVVSIQNKVYNKQCYLEGSFKQPNSPIGYWNAFWLTGRDSWPPEIDIFETLSSKYGHNAWHTAIHGENDTNNLFGKQTNSSINVATSYHTFALDWGYDYVKFYVDGTLFQRGSNHDTITFQKNMRLILNTGIGGWEEEPDDTMVWNDGLRCKYIRSFQY
ncbi:MAG: discoidin domain-containing protein [Clostridia bacterium]